jgi:3-phenylpropionate/cinnamic acid dioxygenase small subunit
VPVATEACTASDIQTWFQVQAFLIHEAELLDDGRLREWLDLLADDLRYQIPIRITRERSAQTTLGDVGFHMDDDKGMLETRVLRLETEYAWAEDPPSRTRRYVTNVRVHLSGDEAVIARSNLLLFRGRHGGVSDQLISCTREDTLRQGDNGFEIVRRIVQLDHTPLGTHNVAIFL